MSGKFTFVLALVTAAAFMAAPSATWAQDDPPPHIPGTLHGTGTHFEITDSDYLNVTVETTDTVTVLLESFGEIVNMHIAGAEGVTSTQVTIHGLTPGITLHRYLDRFENHTVVATGEAGEDVFTLDLSDPRHVMLKTQPSTIYLYDTGWSQPVGTWDPVTRVATLTQDVKETIQISASNIVLDGNGHRLTLSPKDYGVLIPNKKITGITIQNLVVDGALYGVYADGTDGLVLRSNDLRSSDGIGIRILGSGRCRVIENAMRPAAGYKMKVGLDLWGVSASSCTRNSVTGAVYMAYEVYQSSGDSLWHNSAGVDGMALNISESNRILIFNNFFTTKTLSLVSSSTGLQFSLPAPIGGNYWSAWTTPDDNGDGFVDKGYEFAKGYADWLPLTTPVPRTFSITARASEGGIIAPAGSVQVLPGADITFRFLPEPCHGRFGQYVVDCDRICKPVQGDSYTFHNVWASHTISVTFAASMNAPQVAITGPQSGSLFSVGVPMTLTGQFWDETDQTHTAAWYLDGVAIPASESVVDEALQTVTATHVFTAPGVYAVRLVVTDECGLAGEATQVGGLDALVVVYDPNAGFVTGGGWINSPPGAFLANPALTGKMNFGFESKYKKGAAIPTGETEVQLKLAGIDFHSTGYDWMVAGGCMAQYSGHGTVNKQGGYGFLLTLVDGKLKSPRQPDRFRLRIWNPGGADIYDNMPGMPNDAVPTTALGGGSVVIHTGGTYLQDNDPLRAQAVLPIEYALHPVSPSPSRDAVRVRFDLPRASQVRLVVYDVAGREIARLADTVLEPGRHDRVWDGSGRSGRVDPGVYFVRLEARAVSVPGGLDAVRKVVRVR